MTRLLAQQIARQRRALVARLRGMDTPERLAEVEQACIETGGTLIPENMGGNRNPHYAELSLMGIYHQGNDVAEAIANWMKAVMRQEVMQ